MSYGLQPSRVMRSLTLAIYWKQMVPWSMRADRFHRQIARLVHEPAPVTQLPQCLVDKVSRLALMVMIHACSYSRCRKS